MKPQVFVSWSGGKDCSLACYIAMKQGLKVGYLLNMANEDGKHSWTHGLSSEALQIQAQAMGIPLLQHPTKTEAYEENFKKALNVLKGKGITGGVFGDIDLDEHRQWVERVCRDSSVASYLPLWQQNQEKLLSDFIAAGFEAIMVAAQDEFFGEEWLGRKLDMDFVKDLNELRKTKNITPCGEAGEYHTFVVDGPFFKKRISISEAHKVHRDGHWFFQISKCGLRAK